MIAAYARLTHWLESVLGPILMPTAARLVFAGTLLVYYWNSAMTKTGEGISGLWNLDFGAYTQILPRVFDAVGYDPSQIGVVGRLLAIAGTWAELALPALVVLGLLTRPAALGMIGFILVQTWVDIFGHGAGPETLGAWFDGTPGSLIADQRAFWILALLVLVIRGAGPVSVDALVSRRPAAMARMTS
ncbi:DoxX family membrane protein [Rhodobacterales bacterium HKCCE3408]|nr:DoxX family membrane protein [Rhodobacterales bacterium HKCCE3408]